MTGRRITPGVWAWVIQRTSSVVLLIGVPLKVLSGWAYSGGLNSPWLASLHVNAAVDVAVIGAISFHAMFGLRVLLIDSGRIKLAQRLTWPFGIVAAAVSVWGGVVALT